MVIFSSLIKRDSLKLYSQYWVNHPLWLIETHKSISLYLILPINPSLLDKIRKINKFIIQLHSIIIGHSQGLILSRQDPFRVIDLFQTLGNLYFTDSGPFMQTSLQNKQGSVFMYQFDTQLVSCLTFRTLAYPSGLQCDQEEKYLIVAQTGQNRLLKFYINQLSSGTYTVFHQFSGRVGPTAISRFQSNFYVALFQFQQISEFGSIAVINNLGQVTEKFYIPVGPQITGLYISQQVLVNVCSSIFVSQNNKVHKITLKSQTQSKSGDSILLKNNI